MNSTKTSCCLLYTSPDSIYVGRTLKESSLRTLFQINVISITRGEKRLDIPQGEEHLYPYDKVTVVGLSLIHILWDVSD